VDTLSPKRVVETDEEGGVLRGNCLDCKRRGEAFFGMFFSPLRRWTTSLGRKRSCEKTSLNRQERENSFLKRNEYFRSTGDGERKKKGTQEKAIAGRGGGPVARDRGIPDGRHLSLNNDNKKRGEGGGEKEPSKTS